MKIAYTQFKRSALSLQAFVGRSVTKYQCFTLAFWDDAHFVPTSQKHMKLQQQ